MKKQSILLLLFLFQLNTLYAQSNTVGSGISLAFNGNSNNYVDLGDSYNSITFPFTIEAWVKMNSYIPVTSFVFSSDNNPSAYTGVGMHISPGGIVQFYFSSNTGAGPGDRGGVLSSLVVSLNQWTHVAGVAYSATDMRIYINGVQSPVTYSGTATTIASNSSHAFIGRRVDPYGTYTFDGDIDEVRFWNVARSEINIRNFMCRKVNPTTTGLIGYWTADESYAGAIVHDNALPSENGIIMGTVTKHTSGAPIGDASNFLYTSNWAGNSIVLGSPANDKLTAKSITGNPRGVHVYRVDAAPHDHNGLNNTPTFYYGVFCAEGTNTAGYKITYKYSPANGVITADNENSAEVKARSDGSVTLWSDINATLDTVTNKLTKGNQTTRREYILNVSPQGKSSASGQAENSLLSLSIYPNPASEKITLLLPENVTHISTIYITDVTGRVMQEMKVNGTDQILAIDISHFENGIYIVNAATSIGAAVGKFEVRK